MRPEKPYSVCVIDDTTWRKNKFTDGCDGVMRMIRDAGVDMDRPIQCHRPFDRAVRVYCNEPFAFYDCDCPTDPYDLFNEPGQEPICPQCGAKIVMQWHEEFAK